MNLQSIRIATFLGILFLLNGCDFEFPLTGKVQATDQSFTGEWEGLGEWVNKIDVQATVDGYQIRGYIHTSEVSYNFKAVILKIDGLYFLQARYLNTGAIINHDIQIKRETLR